VLAILQLVSYKVAFALALLGGSVDGFAMEETAKRVLEWSEENVTGPPGERPPIARHTLSRLDPIAVHLSYSSPASPTPLRTPGHSLPNGLRAPLRC
jgi:hypothetical protein